MLNHHLDSCHFTFQNGYQKFADRLFNLVYRDIYGNVSDTEIDAPFVYEGFKTYDSLLVIKTNTDSLLFDSIGSFFELNNSPINENEVFTYYNYIIVKNSMVEFDTLKISYLGNHSNLEGNYITNSKKIELVCFEDLSVSEYGGWICNSNRCQFETTNFDFMSLNDCEAVQ